MAKKQQLGYKEIEERLRIIKDNHNYLINLSLK